MSFWNAPQRKFNGEWRTHQGKYLWLFEPSGSECAAANQPVKVGREIGRSFEVVNDRAARCRRHGTHHHLLEVVRIPNFYEKAIKGRLLSFPQDGHTVPGHIWDSEVAKERLGSQSEKKTIWTCVNLKHYYRVQSKTRKTKSIKLYTLPSSKGIFPLLETT